MKVYNKKTYSILFIVSIFLIAGIPLYMYFSDDVSLLNREYPQREMSKDSARYKMGYKKPKDWVNFDEISPFVKGAIIVSEDWSFYDHNGVDMSQMKVALEEMMAGERFRGASTITQQMVKNVFLSQSRSLWRKVHEIILSYKVEKFVTKKKILEVYLNCIEFGPGLYGIRAASSHYFRKNPSALSPREAAFLAMLLPSPKCYYMSFKKKKLTRFAKSRVRAILRKMKVRKIISAGDFDYQVSTPMTWEVP